MYALTLIPPDTRINFIGMRWITYMVSGLLTLGSILLLFVNGLNLGVDFTGGIVAEVRLEKAPDIAALRAALGPGAQVQAFGAPTDLLIRLPANADTKAQTQALHTTLESIYKNVEWRRTEIVGPQVGGELIHKGIYAVLFTLLGIMLYIWVRFEWQFGVATMASTAHDVIAIVGLFALTGMEFSLSSIAAILLIAGYSVNDTVVVFDRIREFLRLYRKTPLPELFNLAVNQTLSRTITTSFVTVLALVGLWAFGGAVLAEFVYALIFGIVFGTYSSVFVAAPLLLILLPPQGQEEVS